MRARCHKDQDGVTRALWDTMSRGRPRQTIEAQELHRLAGVPEGPCGVAELQKFQEALGTEYQLLVVYVKTFFVNLQGSTRTSSN